MLSDVASRSGDPLANAGALLRLSDSVDFDRFTWDDKEGAETALAEIRPTTESVTHGAPAYRDVNREAPPQVAPTRAATVGESAGNSLSSSEVLLQNALSVMQSLMQVMQVMQGGNWSYAPSIRTNPCCVRAMDELYRLANPHATNTEKAERVKGETDVRFSLRFGVRSDDATAGVVTFRDVS